MSTATALSSSSTNWWPLAGRKQAGSARSRPNESRGATVIVRSCKSSHTLLYLLVSGLVLTLACSTPKDVNTRDLLSAIPAKALPPDFRERGRTLGSTTNRYPPPSLRMWYGDNAGNGVHFVIAVEAADARLDRHIQSYDTNLRRAREECDPSADATSQACSYRQLPDPELGENSAAYESAGNPAGSYAGKTIRSYLFVNSRVFASMVIVYSESSLSEDLQRTLLAALDEGVAALVESKFGQD